MAERATTTAFSLNRTARLLGVVLFATATLVAAAVLAGVARAGSAFDGAWKVTIITQAGNCDPAYSYPVRVEGGRVSYSGDGSFDITGQVGEAGAVSVAIARGDQKASASGRLSATAGSGQWSGKSSSAVCSGRWEAVRS